MSKELDYKNLSDEDKQWLRARGWGNRIPDEGQSADTGVELNSTASAEEVLQQTPNTGTATRPNIAVAIEYSQEDYESWKVDDLSDEVKDRNKDREEANQIQPASTKKADLVAALVADDQARSQVQPSGQQSGDSGGSGS